MKGYFRQNALPAQAAPTAQQAQAEFTSLRSSEGGASKLICLVVIADFHSQQLEIHKKAALARAAFLLIANSFKVKMLPVPVAPGMNNIFFQIEFLKTKLK